MLYVQETEHSEPAPSYLNSGITEADHPLHGGELLGPLRPRHLAAMFTRASQMSKCVKENKFLFSQPRIFPPKVLGTSKKGGAASDRLLAAYILLQAAAEKEQLAST